MKVVRVSKVKQNIFIFKFLAFRLSLKIWYDYYKYHTKSGVATWHLRQINFNN